MFSNPVVVGMLAALGAASCWTVCSVAFAAAGKRIGSVRVNQLRLGVALVLLFGSHRVVTGEFWPSQLLGDDHWMLACSGLVGLALGDLLYFHALSVIGPRLGSLMMATWPIAAVGLAWSVRGEGLGGAQWVGIGLTMCGTTMVLGRPIDRAEWHVEASTRRKRWAFVAGLLGAVGQAAGVVMAKDALAPLDPQLTAVPPLSATLVRMAWASVAMAAFGVVAAVLGRSRRAWRGRRGSLRVAAVDAEAVRDATPSAGAGESDRSGRGFRDRRGVGLTAIGALFGPFFGVWLSLVAIAQAPTGAAAALMALSPVLMLPVARFGFGARIGLAGVLGTLVAFAGTVVLVGSS